MKVKLNHGIAYQKDNEKDTLEQVLEKAIKQFGEKYNESKIDKIECSTKDREQKFVFEGYEVTPRKCWLSKNIFIIPIEKGEI